MAGFSPPLPHSPFPIISDFEGDPGPNKLFEHIPSPVDTVMATTPAQKPKGWVKPSTASPGGVKLLVFDILNIFHHHWFLLRNHLLTNVISAQKAEDRNIFWVEFSPPFHAHLVKCTIALVPHPVTVAKVKKVMFVFVLELLNQEGHMAFFELKKCGDSLLNMVGSPGIHEEEVGRQWIAGIIKGGRGRPGPQLML